MMRNFTHARNKPRWLIAGFALALVLTGFFAVRFVASMVYWADPAHLDQQVQGWMTPRYVARSWGVPPDVVAKALELEKGTLAGKRLTMERISEQKGIPLEALETGLIEAMLAHRAARNDG